ncbi:MAG: outer membrane lipoprotein carrier protein LolA [Bacteroidales bacterium]|nr:outer membrane lipoprotein carrier protein LolA [Bacteroidales bacterium]
MKLNNISIRNILTSVFISCIILSTQAQSIDQKLSDLSAFKQKIKTSSEQLKTLKTQFVQEKHLNVLEEVMLSEGRFVYLSPNKVRWEYQKPYYYLMILNNDKVLIKDDQKSSSIKLNENPVFRQINELMISTVKGDILMNDGFSSEVFENANHYKMVLSPKDVQMQDYISRIEIIIDKKDMSVQSIKIEEPMGDFTLITFKQKQINAEVSEQEFSLP